MQKNVFNYILYWPCQYKELCSRAHKIVTMWYTLFSHPHTKWRWKTILGQGFGCLYLTQECGGTGVGADSPWPQIVGSENLEGETFLVSREVDVIINLLGFQQADSVEHILGLEIIKDWFERTCKERNLLESMDTQILSFFWTKKLWELILDLCVF